MVHDLVSGVVDRRFKEVWASFLCSRQYSRTPISFVMIPTEATQKDILHLRVSLKTVVLFASELLVKAAGMCWWTLSIKIQRHLILF